MNAAPMRNVRVVHSCMPQRLTCRSEPVRCGWNRSAAQTPIWQVTELSTRIVVLIAAKVRLSFCVCSAHISGSAARVVKYIAKRPAKNMSSEASHTMVPTETGFGRLTLSCGRAATAVVVDTPAIMTDPGTLDLLPGPASWAHPDTRARRTPPPPCRAVVRRCGGRVRRTSEGEMRDEWDVAEGTDVEPVCRVLLYSDHPQTREAVLLGVGTRAAKDLPRIK